MTHATILRLTPGGLLTSWRLPACMGASRSCSTLPPTKFTAGWKICRSLRNLPVTRISQYPNGIAESRGLDFHSPYGCSKGTGDQYMHDYARIYDIPTVVFRQSCIYGTRQFGVEDQGWVAWFIIAILLGKTIKIYGDGKTSARFIVRGRSAGCL